MKTRNSHGLLQLHVGREALAYCQCASALISGNKALFVSVDLIGEKNQVILEYPIQTLLKYSDKPLPQTFFFHQIIPSWVLIRAVGVMVRALAL